MGRKPAAYPEISERKSDEDDRGLARVTRPDLTNRNSATVGAKRVPRLTIRKRGNMLTGV
jgi:hypothetical protein